MDPMRSELTRERETDRERDKERYVYYIHTQKAGGREGENRNAYEHAGTHTNMLMQVTYKDVVRTYRSSI